MSPTLEVVPHAQKPTTLGDLYRYSISTRGGRGRGNRLYQNKEELIDAISSYFHSLSNDDGTYNRPPTWTGLGLALGFSSKTWDTHYIDTDEFGDVLEHARTWIDTWRREQMVLPGKGVYPAGLMFQQTREEEQAARYDGLKDVTPTEDTRPKEAAALIDDVWRKKDD